MAGESSVDAVRTKMKRNKSTKKAEVVVFVNKVPESQLICERLEITDPCSAGQPWLHNFSIEGGYCEKCGKMVKKDDRGK